MTLSLICVGSMKTGGYRELALEYVKRITPYAKIECVEVKDVPEPRRLTAQSIVATKEQEWRHMSEHIKDNDYVVALDAHGEQLSSEDFAAFLNNMIDSVGERVRFIVGGSLGLSESAKKRANKTMSLSRLTMPHQLARVVLLEQIYRAMKIISGERYHK